MATNTVDPTARAWFSSRTSNAGFLTSDQVGAIMAGSPDAFIVANAQGITIKGPMSFVSGSDQQRFGGLWVGVGEQQDMIPATIVTINPRKTPMPPITGLADLTSDVAFFMALLA